jgi:hypothetical protein
VAAEAALIKVALMEIFVFKTAVGMLDIMEELDIHQRGHRLEDKAVHMETAVDIH